MSGQAALTDILRDIDRRSYRAYKDIAGAYDFGPCLLFIDHVQGDPFAAPSKLRVRVPMTVAALPATLFSTPTRKVAFRDYLARSVRRAIRQIAGGSTGSGKSGEITVDAGGQEVLDRSAIRLEADWVEVRLTLGLPAQGRTVMGRQANDLLVDELPAIVQQALHWSAIDETEAFAFVNCADNQAHIRAELSQQGLVAFVADGSILPRASGASDRALTRDAVPWYSPDELAVTMNLPHPLANGESKLRGTGIRRGVTLIVGGGYHGKSTLLKALERAVYPHVPGDGREYVVCDPAAVKIRAEDGRNIEGVDISPFISQLPQGRSTEFFSSEDASGSTSQATNIMEALEVGARALLMDEDTSATNFMVRDARMQALVHGDDEPITPFVDRVREIYETLGVSTILVMGGSGDYFESADTVLLMRAFMAEDVTNRAKEIAKTQASRRQCEARQPLNAPRPRIPRAGSLNPSRGKRDVKIDAKGRHLILFGTEPIELRDVEQLLDVSQTRAIGHAMELSKRFMGPDVPLGQVLDSVDDLLDAEGLDTLDPFRRGEDHPGDYARPRRFEIAAALNRLRGFRVDQS